MGAGGGDERPAGHLRPVAERGDEVPGAILHPLHAARRRDDGAELLGLHRRPGGQVLAGDPGREAEVVLDAGARGGLPADRGAVERERAQAFGRGVDGGGEPGGSGPDDDDVEAPVRQRVRRQPEGGAEHPRRRALEHTVCRDHDRQIGGGRAEVLEDGGHVGVVVGVDPRVREAVAGRVLAQRHRRGREPRPDDLHRVGGR